MKGVVLCVVPSDLERKVAGTLERAVSGSDVRVVVERRSGLERRTHERRVHAGRSERLVDRRRVRASSGRRLAERRAAVVPVDPPALPRRARGHAHRLRFVTRLETPRLVREDIAAARDVIDFQLRHRGAIERLYLSWFDMTFGFAVMAVGRERALEATQNAFDAAMRSLSELDPKAKSFRAFLFGHVVDAVRNFAVGDPSAAEPVPQPAPQRHGGAASGALRLVSDPQLRFLVQRMPANERDVLLLRYLVGLGDAEVADIVGLTLEQALGVRALALERLRRTLDGNAGGVGTSRREAMQRKHPDSRVLQGRRLALLAS